MNLRHKFAKLKKKHIFQAVSSAAFLIFIAFLLPAFRPSTVNMLRLPLEFFYLLKKEAGGLIFYHRNLAQNERLKKQLGLLEAKINALNEVAAENKRLTKILELKEGYSYNVVVARVIARPADNWSSLIIIDKGSSSGLKEGMAVITYLGLAGRIIEAAESTSKAMLINDPNNGVSSLIQRTRQEGLVTGGLGNTLIMKYLPKDADLLPGDSVVTSGLTTVYPKGLLIGEVVKVGDEFSGLSRYAIIKPAADLFNIEELIVIISK